MTTDAELRRLLAEATPGKWASVEMFDRGDRAFVATGKDSLFATGTSLSRGGHAKVQDADLVVALRNTASSLLDRLAVAEKRAAELEAEIARLNAAPWDDGPDLLQEKLAAAEAFMADICGPTPPTEGK